MAVPIFLGDASRQEATRGPWKGTRSALQGVPKGHKPRCDPDSFDLSRCSTGRGCPLSTLVQLPLDLAQHALQHASVFGSQSQPVDETADLHLL